MDPLDDARRGRAPATLTTLGLAVACSLLATSPSRAQTLVSEGARYAAGTVVTSAAAGVTFRIPDGFEARMDGDLGLFVLHGEGVDAAVWAYSDGALEDVAGVMAADLGELGITAREDAVETTADRLRGSFEAVSERGPGRLVAEVVRGGSGNVLGVAALGGPDGEGALGSLVDAVVASARWSEPSARALAAQAAGALLQASSGGSDYSPGGAGGYGSSASQGSTSLRLCSDGSYGYVSESTTYVSIEGASASSEHRDAHQGRWLLVGDVAGRIWLALQPTDRDEIVWEVKLTGGDGATLDGRSWSAGRAGC